MDREPAWGWIERAAVVVLCWTELLDDTGPAERCVDHAELLQRRAVTRRELRGYLESSGGVEAPEKWVSRTLWNQPPTRGFLDAQRKDLMIGWVLSSGLGAEARQDVERAVRALFVDGAEEEEALHRGRPELRATVQRLLRPAEPEGVDITRVPATMLLADAAMPAYLTDPLLTRIVWTNRSLQAFTGLARDRLAGMPLQELFGLLLGLATPEDQAQYLRRQREVVEGGQMTGHGVIELRVDLSRRAWVRGLTTPPWSGSWLATAHAHFVIEPGTDRRLGSVVMWFCRPEPSPAAS